MVDNTRSDSYFDFDLAWRLRLIHGGADAKALMWIAILIPSWNVVNVVYPENMDNAIIVLPPSISLLIWGGFIFLLLPFVMVIKNLASHGMGPLRLIWHAEECLFLKSNKSTSGYFQK